jgi:hypothetical protein
VYALREREREKEKEREGKRERARVYCACVRERERESGEGERKVPAMGAERGGELDPGTALVKRCVSTSLDMHV